MVKRKIRNTKFVFLLDKQKNSKKRYEHSIEWIHQYTPAAFAAKTLVALFFSYQFAVQRPLVWWVHACISRAHASAEVEKCAEQLRCLLHLNGACAICRPRSNLGFAFGLMACVWCRMFRFGAGWWSHAEASSTSSCQRCRHRRRGSCSQLIIATVFNAWHTQNKMKSFSYEAWLLERVLWPNEPTCKSQRLRSAHESWATQLGRALGIVPAHW